MLCLSVTKRSAAGADVSAKSLSAPMSLSAPLSCSKRVRTWTLVAHLYPRRSLGLKNYYVRSLPRLVSDVGIQNTYK